MSLTILRFRCLALCARFSSLLLCISRRFCASHGTRSQRQIWCSTCTMRHAVWGSFRHGQDGRYGAAIAWEDRSRQVPARLSSSPLRPSPPGSTTCLISSEDDTADAQTDRRRTRECATDALTVPRAPSSTRPN
eukprot:3899314-Rhodomonas_salina.1